MALIVGNGSCYVRWSTDKNERLNDLRRTGIYLLIIPSIRWSGDMGDWWGLGGTRRKLVINSSALDTNLGVHRIPIGI